MKELRQLVGAIGPNKTKSIAVINGQGDTRLDHLYRMIAADPSLTDEAALAALYPGAEDKNAYYKLKHRLRKRLYSSAFFVSISGKKITDRVLAYSECQFRLGLANKLFVLGVRSVAMTIYEKSLRISEPYEFTAERITAVTKLLHWAGKLGERKAFEEYATQLLELTALLSKETIARVYWTRITINYRRDKSAKPFLADESRQYVEHLRSMPVKKDTVQLIYLETMIGVSQDLALRRYQAAVGVLEPSLQRLLGAEVIPSDYLFGVAINLAACHLPLRNFERVAELTHLLYKHLPEGHDNWFRTLEMEFVLYIHTGQYQAAKSLWETTVKRRGFRRRPAFSREVWFLYQAYLKILENAGLVSPGANDGKPFRLAKFLNELRVTSQDKRGGNVSVLIAHSVLLLQQRKYNKIIDRFEALGKYRSRYLDSGENLRGDIFLRLLQLVVRYDFNRAETVAAASELLVLLRSTPEEVMAPYYDQEVIPFVVLWEIVLDLLD